MDNGIKSYVDNGVKVTVYPSHARTGMTPRLEFTVKYMGARERELAEKEAAKTLPKGKTKCR